MRSAPPEGGEDILSPRRLSIWHAALLLPWVIAAVGFRRTFNDNSYLWHVVAGQIQRDQGAVLTVDPFSFTMGGQPWRTQSWLADLFYVPLDGALGLEGTPLITATMASLTFLMLGIVAYRRSKSLISVVLYLTASAVVMAGFLNPRPVIFSFPLFAALVLADDDRRLRWALPPIVWVWAAVHGSFFIGLAYLGLRALGKGLDRRRFAELVLIGLPCLLTAHGWGIVEMLLSFGSNREAVNLMSEWATPDLMTAPMFPLFAAILGLVWMGANQQLEKSDWWLIVPFLALAFTANRAVSPAWIALAPILGRFRVPLSTSNSLPAPAVAAMSLLLAVFPFVLQPSQDDSVFPVEAAMHLSADRVFHDDGVGGWLIYTQWPDRSVYIDDRAELYGEHMERFAQVRAGRANWELEFDDWAIDETLLRLPSALGNTLKADGWSEVYSDENFSVMSRR